MRRAAYGAWLRGQGRPAKGIADKLARMARVEAHHGDLDRHVDVDDMAALIERLAYSVADERCGQPNPSPMPIRGNLRNNLSTYRSDLRNYRDFRRCRAEGPSGPAVPKKGTR